ncbi:aryl-alcohol dehydrogenase [Coniophora puteana RWD-64-598 SS2]|uniref:Aryl-alcohol dehydrogenase n=1 Tax=Coniophora puteana (strain RWD-64-598) TaxID=741705 RepID=A0A5M3N309_CONPW|nr:aryl-alcohol dehydrogenase [Coniophora puteana RWD-64-598 SS2]EIW85770.1 aryl-alcohol dehydrogenase [Coniophora puteana RWD-64-598 SS2]
MSSSTPFRHTEKAPPTRLGRYRLLSPTAAVHVSPLQLGAMSIGDKWHEIGMGSMNKEDSFKLLDAYYEAGGNFIDTANVYQFQSSEEFIGEWAEARGIRDQLVLATKYTNNYLRGEPDVQQQILFMGNNIKSLHMSVEASLKKFRTSYIDILYIHWWDYETSIPEVMNGLHTLVQQGKVLYLGISDTPAWVVAKANEYARCHGKSQFVVYQGEWSVLDRSFEREIIPMARSEGMALAPWGVLGGGKLRTDEEEERRRQTGENGRDLFGAGWERTEPEKKMSAALEKIAKEVGAKHITSVAIAYVLHKTPFVFPIIGGRKVEHLHANIEGLSIRLTKEHMQELESVIPFSAGSPYEKFGNGSEYSFLQKSAGFLDRLPDVQPITPSLD